MSEAPAQHDQGHQLSSETKSQPTWTSTSFSPGEFVALVSQNTLVLIDARYDAEVSSHLWPLVASEAPVEALVEHLAAGGLRNLPTFAFAQIDGGGARVLVRGPVHVRVDTPDGPYTIAGEGRTTWAEDYFPSATAVELRAHDAPEPEHFCVLAGCVPADRLRRVLVVPADPLAAAAAVEWDARHEPALHRGTVGQLTPNERADPAAQFPRDAHLPGILKSTTISEPVLGEPPTLETQEGLTPDEGQEVDAPITPASDWTTAVVLPPAEDYDHLFGATVPRTVERAAVRAVEDEAEAAAGDVPGVIDQVPGAPRSGDHDGQTISKAQLDLLMGAGETPDRTRSPGTPMGPVVQAVHCELDHPNPTHATSCRVCGRPLAERPSRPIARPPLGELRFSTGEVAIVDRPLIIGRAPKLEGALSGELPALIRLPSPEKGLSRTHAEIRIEGWNVLLLDRDSSNGTTLTVPGMAPRRLHPNEAVPISPGAVIDLGGEVTCSFEVVR